MVTALLGVSGGLAEATEEPLAGGPYPRLVIRGATMIDGTGAPPIGPVDILVEKNRITRIVFVDPISSAEESRRERMTGDRVIEAQGMYVLPGIIDLHAHMAGNLPPQYIYDLWLGHGVTTIRLLASEEKLAEKRNSAANEIVAPRMFVYAFWRGGREKPDPRYNSPEGAREVVREWKAKGLDGIKMTGRPGLYPDVLPALCDEARKLGMGVAVHIGQDGVNSMNALDVARAGATTIEHHYGYAEAAFSEKTLQHLPPDYNYMDETARFRWTARVWLETDLERLYGPVLQELVRLSRETGFTMDPTFAVYEANRDMARARSLPWHERFTLPALWELWKPSPLRHATYYYRWTSADEAMWAQMYRRWMKLVNDFKNAGGRVTVGSDPGFIYQLYGFGTIREMELLEEAGFHPLEVLRSATQEGARALGVGDRLGVLREGYLADFVILAENPLEDLKVFYGTGVERFTPAGESSLHQGVRYTIRDGVVYDAQALLRRVEGMVREAKAASAAATR